MATPPDSVPSAHTLSSPRNRKLANTLANKAQQEKINTEEQFTSIIDKKIQDDIKAEHDADAEIEAESLVLNLSLPTQNIATLKAGGQEKWNSLSWMERYELTLSPEEHEAEDIIKSLSPSIRKIAIAKSGGKNKWKQLSWVERYETYESTLSPEELEAELAVKALPCLYKKLAIEKCGGKKKWKQLSWLKRYELTLSPEELEAELMIKALPLQIKKIAITKSGGKNKWKQLSWMERYEISLSHHGDNFHAENVVKAFPAIMRRNSIEKIGGKKNWKSLSWMEKHNILFSDHKTHDDLHAEKNDRLVKEEEGKKEKERRENEMIQLKMEEEKKIQKRKDAIEKEKKKKEKKEKKRKKFIKEAIQQGLVIGKNIFVMEENGEIMKVEIVEYKNEKILCKYEDDDENFCFPRATNGTITSVLQNSREAMKNKEEPYYVFDQTMYVNQYEEKMTNNRMGSSMQTSTLLLKEMIRETKVSGKYNSSYYFFWTLTNISFFPFLFFT